MALPTIAFGTGGSDSAASGAGPATALTGTAATLTNGSGSVAIADAVDLSGVAVDGSAVLWANTASGRMFSKITAVSGSSGAWTVTVEDTAWTAGTVSWAIGGKRLEFADAGSRKLFSADAKAGWTVTTDRNQTLPATASGNLTTGALNCAVGGSNTVGLVTVKGTTDAPRPIVTQALASVEVITQAAAYYRWESLAFQNSNGSRTSTAYGFNLTAGNGPVHLLNCDLGDATNRLYYGMVRNSGAGHLFFIVDSAIHDCVANGITETTGSSTGGLKMYGCRVFNNVVGVKMTNAPTGITLIGNTISANSQHGIQVSGASGITSLEIVGNTIHGNGGTGAFDGLIFDTNTQTLCERATVVNNNITRSGRYGINVVTSNPDGWKAFVDYNNFGSAATQTANGLSVDSTNGSDSFKVNNLTVGPHSLAVNPGYAAASSGDFTIASTSAVAGKGFPDATRKIGANPTTGTTTTADVGASQAAQAGGGGGGTYTDPGIANVRSTTTYTYNSVSQTGTLTVPSLANTKTGVAGDGGTGTYDGSDRWTDPGIANVRLATAYKANSTTNNRTGNVTIPAAGDVRSGTTYDTLLSVTGSLVVGGGGTYTDPGIANVKTGTGYTYNSTSLTGTYDGSDRWTDPGVSNVVLSTAYKANSTTNNRTGTVTLPDVGDVRSGTTYGASLGQTGTLVVSGGGATDWTSAERAQIRYRLGIDGSQTAPTTASAQFINGSPMAISDGTAQAGSTTTITLAASASSAADFYRKFRVYVVAGTGSGQWAFVTAYNGTSKVATLDRTLAVALDSTSQYTLDPPAGANVEEVSDGTITSSKFSVGAVNAAATGILERLVLLVGRWFPVAGGSVTAPKSGNGNLVVKTTGGATISTQAVQDDGTTQTLGAAG